MKYTPVLLREVLRSQIQKLGETPERFARRPGRDFTRPRTLSFETVISLLLTMSENSVGKALPHRRRPAAGGTEPSAGGGRIRPEVRRVSRGFRLLPAWDGASARLESLAFERAL